MKIQFCKLFETIFLFVFISTEGKNYPQHDFVNVN